MKINQNGWQLFFDNITKKNDLSEYKIPISVSGLVFLTDGQNITRELVLPKNLDGVRSIWVKSSCAGLSPAQCIFVKDLDGIKKQYPEIGFSEHLLHLQEPEKCWLCRNVEFGKTGCKICNDAYQFTYKKP